ncbi:hypothetical protein GOODEAATRI_025024 [Goodea atripinnis]|uniref:Uncharacterized protein n=1 Tax=Goodea atripinnis TaxID=208336 RepID=A0ABV0Q0V4_9TELE
MQRRARQDAQTPEKMKRNQSLVANGNLSLEEKKRKILRSLCRLEALGVLRPPRADNQILQMITQEKSRFHSEQVDFYRHYITSCLDNLTASRFKNVVFDITPGPEKGSFSVKARFLGVQMEEFPLKYQDLLQLQYEGVAVMKMFDKAKVNVNLLIFLLNKKFFNK